MPTPLEGGQHDKEQRQHDVGEESVNHPAEQGQQFNPRNGAVALCLGVGGKDGLSNKAANHHGYGQNNQDGGSDQHHHRYFGRQKRPASGPLAQYRAQRAPAVFAAQHRSGKDNRDERPEERGEAQAVGDVLGRRLVGHIVAECRNQPKQELYYHQHEAQQNPRHPAAAQFEPFPAGQQGHLHRHRHHATSLWDAASSVTSRKYCSSDICAGAISAT